VVLGLGRKKLAESLTKTRRGFFGQVMQLFGANGITEETWEDLEALLIQADVGVETTISLVERLRERVDGEHIVQARRVREALREELLALLPKDVPRSDLAPRLLTVVLIVGVNGSGKTTTIAKLTRYYRQKGKRVMLAAADTFRAAAIDQLKLWGERVGVDVIAHTPGADPGAVVYDALQAAQARDADVVCGWAVRVGCRWRGRSRSAFRMPRWSATWPSRISRAWRGRSMNCYPGYYASRSSFD